MSKPTVIYYRFAYSPTTGDVTLAHNHEGHPTDVRFHTDMAEERPEHDLLFGFAHKSANNWKVTDDESRPSDDPNLIYEVVHAITKEEGKGRHTAHRRHAYDAGDEKWAWIEGLPVRKWSDSEIGDYYDNAYQRDTQGDTKRNTYGDAIPSDNDGVVAHFEVLVQLCMSDPKLAEGAAHWEGRSYSGLNYSSVAKYLNESGRKWAVGVSGQDMPTPVGEYDYEYNNGLQMGAHGPTTTKEDVERAIGEPVVMPDTNVYGLKDDVHQAWDEDDLWADDDEGSQPQTFK